jgi:hypothetical protein
MEGSRSEGVPGDVFGKAGGQGREFRIAIDGVFFLGLGPVAHVDGVDDQERQRREGGDP